MVALATGSISLESHRRRLETHGTESLKRFQPAERGSTGLPPCAFGGLARLFSP